MTENAQEEKILFFHQVTKERIQQARQAAGPISYLISLAVAAAFVGGLSTLCAFMIASIIEGRFVWGVLEWGIFIAIAFGILLIVAQRWDKGVTRTTDRFPTRGAAICVTSRRVILALEDYVLAESLLREIDLKSSQDDHANSPSPRIRAFQFHLADLGGVKLKQDFWDRHTNTFTIALGQSSFSPRSSPAISCEYLDRAQGFAIIPVIFRAWANLPPTIKINQKSGPNLYVVTKDGTWSIQAAWQAPDRGALDQILSKIRASATELQLQPIDPRELGNSLMPTPASKEEAPKEFSPEKVQRLLKADEGKEGQPPVSEEMVQQACGGDPILWKGGPHQYLLKRGILWDVLTLIIYVGIGILFVFIIIWTDGETGGWIAMATWLAVCPIVFGFATFDLMTAFIHLKDYYVLTSRRLVVFREKQWHDVPLGQILRVFAYVGTWSGPLLSNYYTGGTTGTIYLSSKTSGLCEEILYLISPGGKVLEILFRTMAGLVPMGESVAKEN